MNSFVLQIIFKILLYLFSIFVIAYSIVTIVILFRINSGNFSRNHVVTASRWGKIAMTIIFTVYLLIIYYTIFSSEIKNSNYITMFLISTSIIPGLFIALGITYITLYDDETDSDRRQAMFLGIIGIIIMVIFTILVIFSMVMEIVFYVRKRNVEVIKPVPSNENNQ